MCLIQVCRDSQAALDCSDCTSKQNSSEGDDVVTKSSGFLCRHKLLQDMEIWLHLWLWWYCKTDFSGTQTTPLWHFLLKPKLVLLSSCQAFGVTKLHYGLNWLKYIFKWILGCFWKVWSYLLIRLYSVLLPVSVQLIKTHVSVPNVIRLRESI